MATNFGVLGRASVDIDVRLDKLSTQVRQGQRSVERSTRAMSRRLQTVEQRINGITTATLKWGAALVGITGATGIARLVTGLARTGDELAKTARSLDLSVEALQEFRFAAERTGLQVGQFDEGLRRFVRRLGLFRQNEGGAGAEAFKELGLAADISSGRLTDAEAAFERAVEALSNVEDAALQTALASQLFGDRVGTQFALIARIGPEGLRALREEAQRLGGVLSTETAEASEELTDAITNLNLASQRFANEVGPGALRATADFVNFLTNDAVPAVDRFGNALDAFLDRNIIDPLREQLRALEQELFGVLELPIPPDRPTRELSVQAAQALADVEAATAEVTTNLEEATEATDELTDSQKRLADILEENIGSRLTRSSAQALNQLEALAEKTKEIEEATIAAGERAGQLGIVPPGLSGEEARLAQEEDAAAARREAALDRASDAARGFSSVFSRAFEDAIFQSDNLTDSITALGEELARVALRVAVIEPLARSLGGALGSTAFGGGTTATAATGAVIPGIGTSGAIINKPTIIPMANGGVLAGERGREAILPLTRMGSGRLGVDAGDIGGQEVQIIDQRGASAPDIQRRTTNNGRTLQLLIRSEVESMFSDGSADPLMGSFGTRRPGIRRG